MRVLTVGNMYPPHHQGGYELVWQGAVKHLRERGHEVTVLTTDHREDAVATGDDEPGVVRELRWWWREHAWPRFGLRERRDVERHNAAVFDRVVAATGADRVAWWSMGGMTLSLIERARRVGLPAAGFVHDDWMLYGPDVDQGSRRPPDFSAAGAWWFVSEHTRARALSRHALAHSGVISSGIDPIFLERATDPGPWRWRLLYAGRIDERKGVLTAVEALAELPAEARLAVAGAGEAHLLAGEPAVELLGPLDKEALRAAYAAADAIVFPVIWEEPWGLVPLEAMAQRRPVVATGRGGSGEYLVDGENCLLCQPADPGSLAAALLRVAASEPLRGRLAEGGATTAREHTAPEFNRRVEEALLRAGPGGGP
jgi:glycosyltransferase involved in cell wall biosynthesis